MKLDKCIFGAAVLSFLVACTQEQPAEVVYKGDHHYTQVVKAHKDALYAGLAPAANKPDAALVVTKREHTDQIFIRDTMSVEPVQTEAEFRQVIENVKTQTLQNMEPDAPMTVVAIPVAKPEVTKPQLASATKEYGMRGLHGVTPMMKPTPPHIQADQPQWHAQRAQEPARQVSEGFIWPVRGKIVSTFGTKDNGEFNDGINIATSAGKPVKAAADGEVVYAGNELEAYGNMLIIRHNNGWMSAYAHNAKMHVGLGHHVAQGQTIAEVGKTGGVQSPQLHFAIRKDQQAVNPLDFLTDSFAMNR